MEDVHPLTRGHTFSFQHMDVEEFQFSFYSVILFAQLGILCTCVNPSLLTSTLRCGTTCLVVWHVLHPCAQSLPPTPSAGSGACLPRQQWHRPQMCLRKWVHKHPELERLRLVGHVHRCATLFLYIHPPRQGSPCLQLWQYIELGLILVHQQR